MLPASGVPPPALADHQSSTTHTLLTNFDCSDTLANFGHQIEVTLTDALISLFK